MKNHVSTLVYVTEKDLLTLELLENQLSFNSVFNENKDECYCWRSGKEARRNKVLSFVPSQALYSALGTSPLAPSAITIS